MHVPPLRLFAILASLPLFACAVPGVEPTSASATATATAPRMLTPLVNPFIGTGGHGHTFPGATMPFGMVQLSPDTRIEGWDGCSGYHDSDRIVYGFSHTHLSGTGVGDYGDVLLMPMTGPPRFENGYGTSPDQGYASRFDKATEHASPGYYEVRLADYGIGVELTATERCGLHRYTFPQSGRGHVILDLDHRDTVLDAALQVVSERRIEGFRRSSAWARDQHVYFVAEFSQPIADFDLKNELVHERKSIHGAFSFDVDPAKPLLVKVGLSAVSIEGAAANLEAELPGWDFEATRAKANAAWNAQLGKILVEGGTHEQERVFYSALYHTMLAPNLFMDVDGRYRGMDGAVHSATGSRHYTVFSLWDTFRATHPLFTLIEQKRTSEFIQTFLRQYEDGGILPIWELAGNYTGCMIGYHAIPVIVDAYVKGLVDFDAELALKAMKHSAEQQHLGLAAYRSQGFIGAGDEPESVSKTLEYSYDDWCIAMLASALGKTDDTWHYLERAQFYKNLFDPNTGFFRAKMNGGWQEPFDPREVNFNFTEANAWQYSLFAPQDVSGLMQLMGGREAFLAHLDQLFEVESATTGREQADITGLIGQYAHGNEPSHHIAYLYSYAGRPQQTQQRVRQIMDELYSDAPDGLSGNEDCGQMSAWFVLSALGFYSVVPGREDYVLGTPLFPKATLRLENGKQFTIRADEVSEQRRYVVEFTLDGVPYRKLDLSHSRILQGGELTLSMSDTPRTDWSDHALPVSAIEDTSFLAVPYFSSSVRTFTKELTLEISTVSDEAEIHFTLDGSTPTIASPRYTGPITLDRTTELRAIAVNRSGRASFAVRAQYTRIRAGRSVEVRTPYADQYAAGGDNALIDTLRGGDNFRTGQWQGYPGDMEVVLDLGRVESVKRIEAGFLQDTRSWIWMPRAVEVATSLDGEEFTHQTTLRAAVAERVEGPVTRNLLHEFPAPPDARYVRVRAENFGVCPDWHLGAGGPAWIFADEIRVD